MPSTPTPKDSSQSILDGCITAVDAIFQTNAPIKVKRALFDTACWLVSERDGKYTPRYGTDASLIAPKKLHRHELVVSRADLWFVVRHGLTVTETFALCEACMATKDEHLRLHAVIESGVYSWERYVKAGVEVLDMEMWNRLWAHKLRRAIVFPREHSCDRGRCE